jgi:hypothetical protein
MKFLGKLASADHLADAKYPEHFMKLIKEKDCLPQKVFNFGETCLFWKKMPTHTFISKTGTSRF